MNRNFAGFEPHLCGINQRIMRLLASPDCFFAAYSGREELSLGISLLLLLSLLLVSGASG
jgi:hypothetical protein